MDSVTPRRLPPFKKGSTMTQAITLTLLLTVAAIPITSSATVGRGIDRKLSLTNTSGVCCSKMSQMLEKTENASLLSYNNPGAADKLQYLHGVVVDVLEKDNRLKKTIAVLCDCIFEFKPKIPPYTPKPFSLGSNSTNFSSNSPVALFFRGASFNENFEKGLRTIFVEIYDYDKVSDSDGYETITNTVVKTGNGTIILQRDCEVRNNSRISITVLHEIFMTSLIRDNQIAFCINDCSGPLFRERIKRSNTNAPTPRINAVPFVRGEIKTSNSTNATTIAPFVRKGIVPISPNSTAPSIRGGNTMSNSTNASATAPFAREGTMPINSNNSTAPSIRGGNTTSNSTNATATATFVREEIIPINSTNSTAPSVRGGMKAIKSTYVTAPPVRGGGIKPITSTNVTAPSVRGGIKANNASNTTGPQTPRGVARGGQVIVPADEFEVLRNEKSLIYSRRSNSNNTDSGRLANHSLIIISLMIFYVSLLLVNVDCTIFNVFDCKFEE